MKRKTIEFNSALSGREAMLVLAYLPVHCVLMPFLAGFLAAKGILSEPAANLLIYVVGSLYMLLAAWRFLRRDFDPLIDNFMHCVLQVCICYGLMLAMNIAVNGALMAAGFLESAESNPNNAAIMDIADAKYNIMAAIAVFMAPLVEELLFRAGIFGLLRRKSRLLAYTVSMLAFAVYHIWSYAVFDASNWIFIVQYLPAAYLLCRCYEKCGSIWASMLLHMTINGISLKVMSMLQELA